MSFWNTLGQVAGGAADTYFRNGLGDKWEGYGHARRMKQALDDSRAEAEMSGGVKTIREVSGAEDATPEEQANATEFVNGLSDSDLSAAKQALAREEQNRMTGSTPKWASVPGLAAPVDRSPVRTYGIPDVAEITSRSIGNSEPREPISPDKRPQTGRLLPAEAAPSSVATTRGPELRITRDVEVPQKSAEQIFESKHLPRLQAQLVGSGRLTEAKALGDWAKDATRAKALDHFGEAWAKLDMNDIPGAMKHLTKFYNSPAMPDGMFAVVKPGKKGEYTVQQFDEKSGRLISEASGNGENLMRQAIGALSGPEGMLKYVMSEFQAKRAMEAEQRKWAHELALADKRAEREQASHEAMMERTLAAIDRRGEQNKTIVEIKGDQAMERVRAQQAGANFRDSNGSAGGSRSTPEREQARLRLNEALPKLRAFSNGAYHAATERDLAYWASIIAEHDARQRDSNLPPSKKEPTPEYRGIQKMLLNADMTPGDLMALRKKALSVE